MSNDGFVCEYPKQEDRGTFVFVTWTIHKKHIGKKPKGESIIGKEVNHSATNSDVQSLLLKNAGCINSLRVTATYPEICVTQGGTILPLVLTL